MTRLTMIRSTLPGVVLFALSAVSMTGPALAADDAARPHHNNDEGHSCTHHDKHHGHGGERSEADMQQFRERMEKLALSPSQKQDMASLMTIYQPRFKELHERGRDDREALLNAAPDADGYSALAYKVSVDAGQTASEVVVLLAELQANAYALLTEEQQAEYRALKVKAMERREQLREKVRSARTRKESSDKGY